MIIILPILTALFLYLLKEKAISQYEKINHTNIINNKNIILNNNISSKYLFNQIENYKHDFLYYSCFSIIFSFLITESIPINISSEKLILFYLTILVIYLIDINKNSFFGSFFLLSALLAITSFSIFSFFLTVEMISFLMLILLNLYIQNQYPGIIYYLFSGLFSALFLLALGYLSMGYIISYNIICVVFFLKLGLAPFHFLLPHIYNSISPLKIFLFDIPSKIILFFLYFRISSMSLYMDLSFIIILSLIVGSIGALRYKNLLTILVYSSVANYGLILLILHTHQLENLIFYLIIYSLMVLIYLYLLISKLIDKQIQNNYYIFSFFILIINLMGIPPFSGFLIKFIPLYISIENYNSFNYIFGIASFSFILLGFTYLRIFLSLILEPKYTNINLKKDKIDTSIIYFENQKNDINIYNFFPYIINNKKQIKVSNKNLSYAHFISSILTILLLPTPLFL